MVFPENILIPNLILGSIEKVFRFAAVFGAAITRIDYSSTNARGNGSQAFGHTLRRLTLTDKCIRAGGKCGLLTGIQMADEDNDQRGRAGLAEFIQGRSRRLGSRSQSTNNISRRLAGAWANVVDQSAASPTTSIFRSSSSRRRAERSSGWESAKYTRVIVSSYNKGSPAASSGRGVLFSATWGRRKKCRTWEHSLACVKAGMAML